MILARSRELFEESQRFLAGGVASTLRLAIKPSPLFISHGRGSHIFDVDGNEYVDYTMAYGPLILGHAPPAIVAAVGSALARGSTFGAQHVGEIELARRICECVPNAERVCFSGSGTEAVMLALRLARAATGRQKVIRFGGHYHGWWDGIFTAFGSDAMHPGTGGQSEAALRDLVVLPWNDAGAVAEAIAAQGTEIAAVICEPVLCNSGCLLPRPGYLEELRRLTSEHDCLLVFDEVITSFRLGLGGAQERYGVEPDLAVFGKALAGGLPLSAVAGRREVMELVATGEVSHLGTLNGNTACAAAALATLEELARDGGGAYVAMNQLGEALAEGLREAAASVGVPLVVNSAGEVFFTLLTEEDEVWSVSSFERRDQARGARFAELLLGEGVYIRPNGLWYVSTAHTEADVEYTLAAVRRALAALSGEEFA
jgi:glutamate-1-semialdehyde 2,1-aminomutase